MKQLSIEQKAKRYDEAIKKAGERYNEEYTSTLERSTLAYVFPSLKESEGERIKSDIQYAVRCAYGDNSEQTNKILGWVEKQGEQKSADKVEPKFRAGNWVVIDGEVLHVKEVTEDGYLTDEGGLIPFRNEKEAHIWTIKDAKDGDVLSCGNDIVIFKENSYNPKDKSGCMFVYCSCNNFYEIGGINPTDYKPATKEQRNLLFQKMNEAGYEWDAEKKELEKIEQNPAWSKEDEKEVDILKAYIHSGDWSDSHIDRALGIVDELVNKVKFIGPQLKQEWSGRDEAHLHSLITHLEQWIESNPDTTGADIQGENIAWLKSLKDRVIDYETDR